MCRKPNASSPCRRVLIDTDAVGNRLDDGVVRACLEDVLLAARALPLGSRKMRALARAGHAAELVTLAGFANLALPAAPGIRIPAAGVLGRVLFRFAEEDGREER